jgi:purine-binding chemotaxis protein CheW
MAGKPKTSYLSFLLGGNEYAIDIVRVREVIEYETPTKVGASAPSVLGVINLRGTLVPVIDLKLKFGLQPEPPRRRSCIVVVEVDLGGEPSWLGLLADEASQVLELDAEALAPAPGFGAPLRPEYLLGMAPSGRKFMLVLDIARILSLAELQAADTLRAPAIAAP